MMAAVLVVFIGCTLGVVSVANQICTGAGSVKGSSQNIQTPRCPTKNMFPIIVDDGMFPRVGWYVPYEPKPSRKILKKALLEQNQI